jgi:hypothetical protein
MEKSNKALVVSSFVIGIIAAGLYLVRNQEQAPSPAHANAVAEMGFDSAAEFKKFINISEKRNGAPLDGADLAFIREIALKNTEASELAIGTLRYIKDNDLRMKQQQLLESYAEQHKDSYELTSLISKWHKDNGNNVILKFSKSQQLELASICKQELSKGNK